jgi:hypothetical protein
MAVVEHDTVTRSNELTPGAAWQAVTGSGITDELLEWPPDMFALTHLVLQRSETYRFAFSPPRGAVWPPDRVPDWGVTVADAGRRWSAWLEDRAESLPTLLGEEWAVFRSAVDIPLERLSDGQDWRVTEALLTLQAIADEACAGLGVALTAGDGNGALYRARGRELLARKGSLSRLPVDALRVLPKVRTAPNGTSSRTLSRYVGVHAPGVDAHWYKTGARDGSDPKSEHRTFLLLPWPLRVRGSDFRALDDSVRGRSEEPFGLFEFAPSDGLDLDLVERTLIAALDEVTHVDIVVLPESAVAQSEIRDLETLLARYRVSGLIAGVRGEPEQSGRLPRNWVHLGMSTDHAWAHIRQNKHHRWSLNEAQIDQYHLGAALHPHTRWSEDMDVPRRSLQFLESDHGVTFASVVCEDLAQIDEVADVMRSVGPTIVITPLLDGPQLSSRWAARYASVLADDPGSAVLTLTSYGMVRRCVPNGHTPSPVVALWRDPVRGTREIPLEPGAHGVLLTADGDLTVRRSGDGRHPVNNCTEFYDVSVHQVHAANPASAPRIAPQTPPPEPRLKPEELTILMSWAEAIAEVLASTPERLDRTLIEAHDGRTWRAELGIAELSPALNQTIDAMGQLLSSATPGDFEQPLEDALTLTREPRPDDDRHETLARRALRSALEQRRTRQAKLGLSLATGHLTDQP